MIGGLSENPISRKLLSASIPYYQDDITWCVPKARLAATWLNVFIIFGWSTWLAFVIVILFTSILIYRFNKIEGRYNENIFWSLLQSLAISLSSYAHYWPNRSFIQVFLLGYFFYGIHFNTAYRSSLIQGN